MSSSDSALVFGHGGSHTFAQPGFVIVSPKHTRKGDPFITFWRPDRCGYAWPLSWAGVYSREDAEDICDHLDTFAVPHDAALAMAGPPKPGLVDGNAGPVIRRTAANMAKLRALALPLAVSESTEGGAVNVPNPNPSGHPL